jgi:hypothetical protein
MEVVRSLWVGALGTYFLSSSFRGLARKRMAAETTVEGKKRTTSHYIPDGGA